MGPGIRIQPLGGIGRFGANSMIVEDCVAHAALVIDCGVRLTTDEPFGFDVALPDLSPLSRLDSELWGYMVTHAHEDHVGALPFALERRRAPIYATTFSARMIERRFSRSRRPQPLVHQVRPGAQLPLGPFEVEWVNVSHSIPGAAALAVRTRVGTVVHSGDFRIDDDPVLGEPTDMERLTALGDEGVYLLLSDSTGAAATGRNPGEKSVSGPLLRALERAPARAVVATFSSHVPRLRLLEELCAKLGRRLCILGRGMREVVEIAQRQGLLSSAVLTDEGQILGVPRERQVIAVTGSQGEPGSALWRLAEGRHPVLALERGDLVVLSARVIPGAEPAVQDVTERLRALGATVLDGGEGRHVSGHGSAGDLELLLAATRPRFFVALHGAPRQLRAHRELAAQLGVAKERVLPVESGDTLHLLDSGGARIEPGKARAALARGPFVVDEPGPLLAARRRMAEGGTLVVLRGGESVRLLGRALDPALDEGALEALRGTALEALESGEDIQARLAARIARLGARVPEIVVVE